MPNRKILYFVCFQYTYVSLLVFSNFVAHLIKPASSIEQASGSGIPELKTILGGESLCFCLVEERDCSPRAKHSLSYLPRFRTFLGFVMRGYLGGRTLATKAIALPMSVASGLTLGM